MSGAEFDPWLGGSALQKGPRLDWLETKREAARAQVRDQGIPTSKQEAWRYTSLKRLLEQGFLPVDEPITALQPEDIEDVLIPGLESHQVVLVNGRYLPGLSKLGQLPPGVRIGGLRQILASDPDALRDRLNGVTGDEQPLFAALNTAGLDDGLVILLERGATLEQPVELIHLSVGMDEPRVAQPRHIVAIEDGGRATLIERYVTLGQSLYCTNSVLEISLGRDAQLKHQRIQDESPSAFHITGLYLRLGESSRYAGLNIGLGGAWARTDLQVRFSGEHAQCDLQGLYMAGDQQLMDYHLDVDHRLPHCTSRENFKGILYGKGRAVFDGRVYVAKDAQKTDAAMSNRNLLLSDGAEVDAKPQLEINADDVKCSHGTTVGQLEPEMLFYLRSRGIKAPLARRMLCLGFAGEILDGLEPEPLRERVADQVGHRLENAPLD
ncbi:MAG: Fe-S cluster assembly protein SufD [Bdellovibrio bacteriovorus]